MTSDQNLSTADLANPAPRTATTDHDAAGSEAGSRGRSATDATRPEPLLPPEEGERYRRDWENMQTRFVDEPREAVEQADSLVASLMKQLAEGFATERSNLEGQWAEGGDVSTEDLRIALQRYRSFFQRLLVA